jgi:hypothetical protein
VQSELRDAIKIPILRDLHRYWNDRLNDQGVFLRERLEPSEITAVLPHVFLMDVLHDDAEKSNRFRYRLTGTFIDSLIGKSIIGLTIEEFRQGPTRDHLLAFLAQSTDLWTPGYSTSNLVGESSEIMIYSRLILPMSFDGTRVDQILGGWVAQYHHENAARGVHMDLEKSLVEQDHRSIFSSRDVRIT